MAAEQRGHSKILTVGSEGREVGQKPKAECRQRGKVSNKGSVSQRGSAWSLQSLRPDGDPQERAGSKIHLPSSQGAVPDKYNTSGQVRRRDLGFLLLCKEDSQLWQSHWKKTRVQTAVFFLALSFYLDCQRHLLLPQRNNKPKAERSATASCLSILR